MSVSKEEFIKYLNDTYTSEWFDMELSNRVNDYISEEEAEDYDGDYEEAYKNLATGGAIEYDLLEEISRDVVKRFNIEDYYNSEYSDLVTDHLMDKCEWYDRFVFKKKGSSNDFFGNIDYKDWDIKLESKIMRFGDFLKNRN